MKWQFVAAAALALGVIAATVWHTASRFYPDWEIVRETAEFSIRDTSQPFVFDDAYWLSNGYLTNYTAYRDLWRSKDGREWEIVNEATPYDTYSAMAVHNGYIYAAKNTVWRSKDGVEWEQLTSRGPTDFPGSLPMMRSFNGHLWFFHLDEVSYSKDGVIWTRVEEIPFGRRASYAVEVFNDALWLFGGGRFEPSSPPEQQYPERTAMNDVWRSEDGSHWEKMADAPWEPRMWPSTVVYEDRLYVVGGFSNAKAQNLNSAWYTDDGRVWEELTASGTFSPRHWVSLFPTRSGMLLAAGNAWPLMNDVWHIRLAPWWKFWL